MKISTDAITNLLGHILSDNDKKKISIGLFIDMSKAFDTINFDTLLYKLEKYGIRGHALNWFKNYLTNRTQRVKLMSNDGKVIISETNKVTYGVNFGPSAVYFICKRPK
jgi:hypothetical protein